MVIYARSVRTKDSVFVVAVILPRVSSIDVGRHRCCSSAQGGQSPCGKWRSISAVLHLEDSRAGKARHASAVFLLLFVPRSNVYCVQIGVLSPGYCRPRRFERTTLKYLLSDFLPSPSES